MRSSQKECSEDTDYTLVMERVLLRQMRELPFGVQNLVESDNKQFIKGISMAISAPLTTEMKIRQALESY